MLYLAYTTALNMVTFSTKLEVSSVVKVNTLEFFLKQLKTH